MIWWSLVDGRLSTKAVLSEWLRSLTRNQMGSARTGSNPVDRALLKPIGQIKHDSLRFFPKT